MEVELKLLCSAGALRELAENRLLRQFSEGEPHNLQLFSIYFDTPEFFLRRHGLGLRVRKVGGRWVQTLKGGGGVASGLHQREEWESSVVGKRPDLGMLQTLVGVDSPVGKLLADVQVDGRLRRVFTTEFNRIAWPLRLPGGQRVECALDSGSLACGSKTEAISEVELELKSGDAGGLFDLAQQLMASVSFRLGHASKAARGYALCEFSSSPSIVKAGPLRVSPRNSLPAAGRKIFGNCLAHVHGNEEGVIHGSALESVHQMRVGLRRLRSAIGLFGTGSHFPAEWVEELRWVTSELAGARDWEVFASETLGGILPACPAVEMGLIRREDIAAIKEASLVVALEQRQRAAECVQSERYARLAIALGAWQHSGRWFSPDSSTARKVRLELKLPVRGWATARLTQLFLKLTKRGKNLPAATAVQKHRARIAAKKLRYALEFFRSFYPKRKTGEFVAKLKRLQDALGRLNDVFVADAHLRSLADRDPELSACAHFLRGLLAERSQSEAEALMQAWQRFKSASVPWV